MKVVAARSRGHVEHAPARPTHLGVVRVYLDLDLLDRLDRRIEHGATAQFRDGHAVEQVVVGADAAAAERDARGVGLILLAVELGVPHRHHRRHGDADQEGVASGRRQRLERLAIQRSARRRGRRVDERRLSGHRDRFLEPADLERDVDRDELLGADRQALGLVPLVPGDLSLQGVAAWRDRREVVLAHVIGDHLARVVRRLVGQRDRHARHDAVGVVDCSAHSAGELLRERQRR